MQTYLLDQFSTWFPSLAEPIALLIINVAQIIGILVVAKIIKAIINRYLVMWVEKSQGSERATTLSQLIKTTLSFLIWFLVILLSLDTVGVNITPILASAGGFRPGRRLWLPKPRPRCRDRILSFLR